MAFLIILSLNYRSLMQCNLMNLAFVELLNKKMFCATENRNSAYLSMQMTFSDGNFAKLGI